MSIEFPLGAKVRFTQKRLSVLTPRDRQGLTERIGTTQTDSAFVSKPTVYFPAEGSKPELRLFRVDPTHLELVEIPTIVEITSSSSLTESENLIDHSLGSANVESSISAADNRRKLSPNEIDNLFD